MITNKQAKYLKFMGIKYNAKANFKDVITAWSVANSFGPLKLFMSIPVTWIINITHSEVTE